MADGARGSRAENPGGDESRIEREMKRDPNQADTRIARATQASLLMVRQVRKRLGIYPTGPS